MKRSIYLRLAGLIGAVMLLCGCHVGGRVEDLLRAPQLSGDAKAVQSALNNYLGETIQLRYPNHGDFLTPYFFGDWNGDGEQDAAVLYQASSSVNVQMALLQKNDADVWQVMSTAEGLSATVESVRLAMMLHSEAEQIIVGYSTAGDSYLAIYNLEDGQLVSVLQQPYNQYLVDDITGDQNDDLIVLTDGENGKMQVQVLIGEAEGFTRLPVVELSEKQFSGYASMAAGQGGDGTRVLVLDGWTGAGGQDLASVMFRYDPEHQRMVEAKLAGTPNLYNHSLRYATCLISQDLNGDGIVDIPVQANEGGVLNLPHHKRYSFVQWMDFTSRPSEESFGLLDESYGVYLQLPSEWAGNLLLTEGAEDTLELYNMNQQLLLRLRITDKPAISGWHTIGLAASQRIQAQIVSEGLGLDIATLRKGIYLL